MLQDSETTTEYHLARRGPDGLAQIGPSKFHLRGIRFIVDPEPNDPTSEPAEPAEDPEGAEDPEEPGQEPEDPEFDGEFDPKRARALITKLRDQLKADAAAKAPKDAPDVAKTQAENLRLRVALATGLDEDLADRLRGTTREELIADAEKLVARLAPGEKRLEDRTPKVRLRGGTTPDKDPEVSSDDVAKAILGR
jgi:hypothetical protein